MAKKMLIESPPPSSSEEESSSSEEGSSSDEEIQLKKRNSESNSQTATNANEKSLEETDEDDSEDEESNENNETEEPKPKSEEQDGSSDSEEESDEEGTEDNEDSEEETGIKVEVPKPSEESKPVESDRGKQSEVKLSTSASPLNGKTEDGDTKKDFFARLWSFEDEIILLNSILKCSKENKEIDSSNIESFCEFLKGKLSFTDKPEHRQVLGKIKALKKKYTGTAVALFSNEHDLKMKDIASQLWVSEVKSKPLERKCSLLEEEVSRIVGSEKKFDFVVDAEVQALEEELREQKRMKLEHDMKRMYLINETFKLIMEGIQKLYGL